MTLHEDYFRYLDHFGTTCTVHEMAQRSDARDLVALRHDVDHDIDVALEMGYWEHRHDVRSTYYILPTAPYWRDPDLAVKCRQLVDFGHEVGLHVNSIASWLHGEADSVEDDLRTALDRLRADSVEVVGTSAHGDPACYNRQFINYWCFEELKPDDPLQMECGLTAEGIPSPVASKVIDFPRSACLVRDDGQVFEHWSISMTALGLEYDAIHVPVARYFSDSGGGWTLTDDPLTQDLSTGRVQILIHPIHWRGEQRLYFFLSSARAGSTWVSRVLERATSFEARHEFALNHEFDDAGPVPHKRTLDGLHDLQKQPVEVDRLLAATRDWLEEKDADYAEANVYLVHFLTQLEACFPDATLVCLHRHPAKVVRSLMNRDWYDTPDDQRHPIVDVEGWDTLDQFSKVCWYVRAVGERLMPIGRRVSLENLTADVGSLSASFALLGIPFYPLLAADLMNGPVNASVVDDFPDYDGWSPDESATFQRICGDLCDKLFYHDGARAHESVSSGPAVKIAQDPGPVTRERSLLALDVGARPVWMKMRSATASLWRPLRERISPGRAHVVASGGQPHERVEINCRGCGVTDRGSELAIRCPDPAVHARLVIGGGDWYKLPGDKGWPCNVGSWYRGDVELRFESDFAVMLYCLMYDDMGEQVYRRSLVQFGQSQPRRLFGFKTRRFAARFCLALYMPATERRDNVALKSLRLCERAAGAVTDVHRTEY